MLRLFLVITVLVIAGVSPAYAVGGNTNAFAGSSAALEAASLHSTYSSNRFNINNISPQANEKKIMEKSKELEGVFLSIMMEPMFPDGKDSDIYGGGNGSKVFRTMMLQEYGKIFASAGGVGLTDGIAKQIRRRQQQN